MEVSPSQPGEVQIESVVVEKRLELSRCGRVWELERDDQRPALFVRVLSHLEKGVLTASLGTALYYQLCSSFPFLPLSCCLLSRLLFQCSHEVALDLPRHPLSPSLRPHRRRPRSFSIRPRDFFTSRAFFLFLPPSHRRIDSPSPPLSHLAGPLRHGNLLFFRPKSTRKRPPFLNLAARVCARASPPSFSLLLTEELMARMSRRSFQRC